MDVESAALAVVAFMMNVGARHITFDMTEAQRKFMQHPAVKGGVLFSMFLVTTRKVTVAIVLTLAYFLIIHILLNENHEYNMFSRPWLVSNGFATQVHDSIAQRYKNNLQAVLFNPS